MAGEIIVLITASSEEEAAKIGTALVEAHFAACVSIIPRIRSIFIWEGKTQDACEVLLICKSLEPLLARLVECVKALHSYTVPEIIALPLAGGSADYLSWLHDAVKI